jgi:leucyl/phenylalanyl-tRNA--protein transferase
MSTPRPIEPPSTGIRFPSPRSPRAAVVLAVGEDFRPGTLLAAYRQGIFPWPHDVEARDEKVVAWFSPDPRALFPIDEPPHFSRSLRRTLRKHRWTLTVDADFRGTMLACGEVREEGTWIIPSLVDGYVALHELGWAHSLEVWEEGEGGARELVGGIYGVAIGRVFCAESMFHKRTDASKVAFATLAARLRRGGYAIFDVQVMNPHLESLGCVEIPRGAYLDWLEEAQEVTPTEPLGPETLDPHLAATD